MFKDRIVRLQRVQNLPGSRQDHDQSRRKGKLELLNRYAFVNLSRLNRCRVILYVLRLSRFSTQNANALT